MAPPAKVLAVIISYSPVSGKKTFQAVRNEVTEPGCFMAHGSHLRKLGKEDRRLAALGGTEPKLAPIPRLREVEWEHDSG